MADVLILPLALTLEGVHRLRDELEAVVREGGDFGTRRSQIARLSISVASSLEQLKVALPASVERSGLDKKMAGDLVETATRMARIAQLVGGFAEE